MNIPRRVINKIKRIINTFFSKLFIRRISISTKEKNIVQHLSNNDYFTFQDKTYHYIGVKPYWTNFKNIKLRNLYVEKLSNVEIIDRGVIIDSEGDIILESTIFQKEYLFNLNCNHWIFFRRFLPFKNIEKAIVLTNRLDNNYYHWIMECLNRLATLQPKDYENYKIILDSEAQDYAIESLIILLNVKPKNIHLKTNKRIKVGNVLIPSFPHTRNQSTAMTNVYTPSIIKRINSISKEKTTLVSEKRNFIIARKQSIQRSIINLEIIPQKFQHLKFEIIYLEDLKFMAQMQLFRNAGLIIATHGAGLTNLIFAQNPIIIEFFPSNRLIRDAFYFYQISNALNFTHYLIQFETKNKKQSLLLNENHLSTINSIIKKHSHELVK